MDKFEYKVRADEIKELISREQYARAAEIADTIDWRRVKSVMMLCTISDLYKINRRYEDARDILLLAYDRRPGGRTICYSLCELSIKMDEIAQAKEYLDEFVQIAPKDPGRYVLQYKMYEALDVSIEERIEVLVKLKEQDPRERWQYELAYLYHKIGLESHCVEECDELILWFGDGRYVIKAMELKMLHQPLSEEQQEQYDAYKAGLEKANRPAYEQAEEQKPAEFEDMPIQVKTMDVSPYNTINLQAELAQDLEKVLSDNYQPEQSVMDDITKVIVSPLYDSDTESFDNPEIAEVSTDDIETDRETEELRYQTVDFSSMDVLQAMQQAEAAEQARLAAEAEAAEQAEAEQLPVEEATLPEEADDEPAVETEVFFGETVEISDVEEALSEENTESASESVEEVAETVMEDAAESVSEDNTRDTVMEQLRLQNIGVMEEPPKFMAKVLSQEADGQLSLVMPDEKEVVEKQITGQLNLNDILLEWERIKKENEEKRMEDVRQRVLRQTGSMFTEFEATMRDGLLEKLESGEVSMDQLDEKIEEMTEAAEDVAEAEGFAVEPIAEMPEEIAQVVEEPAEELAEEVIEEGQEESAGVQEEIAEAVEEPAEDLVEEVTEEVPEETAEVQEEIAEAVEVPAEEPAEEVVEEAQEEAAEVQEEIAEAVEVPAEEPAEEVVEEVQQESVEVPVYVKPEVEREKAKVRTLSREERDLFAPFIPNKTARDQLINVLDNVSMASFTGNLIITGEEGIDIITLAKNIVAEIRENDSNFSGKIAKISGGILNDRNVEETLEQLSNGALIIHGAADLKADTINRLHRVLQQENFGIVVILEDTKPAMNRLLKLNPILKESFTARMDVDALSNDLLVGYGKKYALDNEYFIDDLGVLALHTKIENMQTNDHTVTTAEVRGIVDEAISHVNRKNIGHFFDILLAKRYNAEDMVILSEKDFT